MRHETPDNVLVEEALAGQAESFTELCGRYYPAMVAIGHAILGDRHLAEDAAQQGFAKAAMKLSCLRKGEQFGQWVAAICRNEARDLARSRRQVLLEGASRKASESVSGECEQAVREALGRLAPAAREVIYLRFYDGLSYEGISDVLGISEQAINGRLRRAKRELAEHLRREGFGEVKI